MSAGTLMKGHEAARAAPVPCVVQDLASAPIDHQQVFQLAPVGLVVARHRAVQDCNDMLCEIFGYSRELILNQSLMRLYPSRAEFERQGQRMLSALMGRGVWADQRIMRRANGENFWCRVAGRAFDRQDPHAGGIWSFEDLGTHRALKAKLTSREREVAARLLDGLTSKEIARVLGISHRTVETHRASLMRKYGASTAADLVHKLMQGLSD